MFRSSQSCVYIISWDLATEKNKRMLPGQLSLQARGFRNKSLHWWRNSSKTNICCRNIVVTGVRVFTAELKSLDYNTSSSCGVSMLHKGPSALSILTYLIFAIPLCRSYSYAIFQGRKLRNSFAQDCITRAEFQSQESGPFKILS